MPEQLYAHYYVRLPAWSPEVYVKVLDFDDDNRARVLCGSRIIYADDEELDTFEFIALVRESDLYPFVQVQDYVTFVFPRGRRIRGG